MTRPVLILVTLFPALSLAGGCWCSSKKDGTADSDVSEQPPDGDTFDRDIPDETIDTGTEDTVDTIPDIIDPDVGEDPPRDFPMDLETPEGCEVPIMDCGPGCRQLTCAGPVREWDVWGDRLVYSTTESGYNPYYIYVVDIMENTEMPIHEFPLISGDRPLVWSISLFENRLACNVKYTHLPEEEPGEYIYLIDIVSGTSQQIISLDKAAIIRSIDLFGDNLVWYGYGEGEYNEKTNIYLFNLDIMEMRYLTNEPCCNWQARIYDTKVVYHDGWTTTMSHDCKLIDIETEEEVIITNHDRDQWDCRIWGNRIAWTDHRNSLGGYYSTSNADIYWCDLPDCDPHHAATTNWAGQILPEIWEDIIVWMDFRNDHNPLGLESPDHSNLEIWGVNVNEGEEVQLASHDRILDDFRVHNNKLFFKMPVDPDDLYKTSAVFMKDLPF